MVSDSSCLIRERRETRKRSRVRATDGKGGPHGLSECLLYCFAEKDAIRSSAQSMILGESRLWVSCLNEGLVVFGCLRDITHA